MIINALPLWIKWRRMRLVPHIASQKTRMGHYFPVVDCHKTLSLVQWHNAKDCGIFSVISYVNFCNSDLGILLGKHTRWELETKCSAQSGGIFNTSLRTSPKFRELWVRAGHRDGRWMGNSGTCSVNFWKSWRGYCSQELTTAMVAHTRPTQSRPNSGISRGDAI